MTRDEILAMKPGREMDALAARKAMGWTHIITKDQYGGVYVGWPPDRSAESGEYIPHYSTDDAAAMKIVPAMAKRGWDFAVYYWAESERYTAYFLRDSRHEGAYAQAEAGALPEAICKAALLALLKKGERT